MTLKKNKKQNRQTTTNKQTEIEQFDWFIEWIQTQGCHQDFKLLGKYNK